MLDNEGNGRFRVVDSNSAWDGIVRTRDPYDPAAEAARYPGISIHVYRFPETSTPPADAQPSGAAANAPALTAGASATVASGAQCLRLRAAPGLSAGVVSCLPSGLPLTVTATGPQADGYHWVEVAWGSLHGWLASEYLVAATPSAATPPAPAPPRPPHRHRPQSRPRPRPQPAPAAVAPPAPATADQPPPAATPASTPPTPAPRAPAAAPATYTVVPGDTLSGIAARLAPNGLGFRDFLDAIDAANGLGADSILAVGRVIVLPSAAAANAAPTTPPAAAAPSAAVPAPVTDYSVAPGDTLSGIAARFEPAGGGFAAFLDAIYWRTASTHRASSTSGRSS